VEDQVLVQECQHDEVVLVLSTIIGLQGRLWRVERSYSTLHLIALDNPSEMYNVPEWAHMVVQVC
jgi:hypothetical protein